MWLTKEVTINVSLSEVIHVSVIWTNILKASRASTIYRYVNDSGLTKDDKRKCTYNISGLEIYKSYWK